MSAPDTSMEALEKAISLWLAARVLPASVEATLRALAAERDAAQWQLGQAKDACELALDVGKMLKAERDAALADAARLRKALEEANFNTIAFCAPWAVEWARDHGLPPGHMAPNHYDILHKAGARMDNFTRAALDAAP